MEIVLPKIVSIGIYNSQVAVKNATVTKKRKTVMFELEIPIESGGISYIDSEQASITPDMVICAKPGQLRHTKLPFKCYYVHMIVNEGVLYESLTALPNYIKPDNPKKYQDIFKKLYKYYNTIVDDEIMIQSLILELIYHFVNDSKRFVFHSSNVNKNNHEMIEKVLKYIEDNLTSDLSLKTISKYACLSPIHFHNCFKSSTGKTLHEYVEEQRIKKASNMLVATDKTLTEIAYKCGFSSQSYFSYAFKKKMNVTPRQYAKMIVNRYETQDDISN